MIVDTHLHLVYRERLAYPWLSGAAALNADFPYQVYETEAHRLGIGATLHMEVDVAEADIEAETAMVEEIAARPGSLVVGAIASCRPENSDFAATVERAVQNRMVRGFRRVLHVMPDELSESPVFRENVRRLTGTGLTFDLCVLPHQIEKAIALADLAPDVSFILDHCGVPDIKSGAYEAWEGPVAEIARRPNVTVKLSGLPAYGSERWTLEDLKPYFAHVSENFGFNRMIWGSDWPVCTLGGGLSTWVGATHALFEGIAIEDKAKVLSGNATALWRL